jgi:hypothetical protein
MLSQPSHASTSVASSGLWPPQVRSTEENLHFARHWLSDSARLRKAIRHAIFNARSAEHTSSHDFNNVMMNKLSTTHRLKEDLEGQLARVRRQRQGSCLWIESG